MQASTSFAQPACSGAGCVSGRRPVLQGQQQRRAPSLLVRAEAPASSNGSAFPDGARVKVVKPVKVYHVPKHNGGVQLEGMEGEVAKNAAHFKGKVLSPNLPIVVKFVTRIGDADAKFSAHLAEEELAAL